MSVQTLDSVEACDRALAATRAANLDAIGRGDLDGVCSSLLRMDELLETRHALRREPTPPSPGT